MNLTKFFNKRPNSFQLTLVLQKVASKVVELRIKKANPSRIKMLEQALQRNGIQKSDIDMLNV